MLDEVNCTAGLADFSLLWGRNMVRNLAVQEDAGFHPSQTESQGFYNLALDRHYVKLCVKMKCS
jgi:hypothetical protein